MVSRKILSVPWISLHAFSNRKFKPLSEILSSGKILFWVFIIEMFEKHIGHLRGQFIFILTFSFCSLQFQSLLPPFPE